MIDYFLSIPGWLTENEGRILQQLSKNKRVLEIGCFKGRSSSAIAAVCNELTCLDHFEGDKYAGKCNSDHLYSQWLKNVLPFKEKITIIKRSFYDTLPGIDLSSFDFIFYDACHSGEAVKFFFEHLSDDKKISSFAIHDYELIQPQYADSIVVIDKFIKDKNLPFKVVDSLLFSQGTKNETDC